LGLPTIGILPALIALFIYSLLPILVSTHSGLKQIPQSLQDMSDLLSLSPMTKILKIELPLAWPSIINGIKISAVLNVGFATLGALVGAGGYGQLILTGIRLDDTSLILQGAVPAALLAMILQKIFNQLAKPRFN
jgi:osmoprotectant transport system permease protein